MGRRRRGRPRIKRAVIVGIDQYQVNGLDLNGCVNDARDFYRIIKKYYGFKKKYVKVLLNSDATKDNILTELDNMIARTKNKQEAVYYQSGHGAQMVDKNGDEIDRLDEVVIPHDYAGYNASTQQLVNVISDDEIANIFKNLRENAYLSMICDTCYSGGAARGVGNKTLVTPTGLLSTKDLDVSHFGVKDSHPASQRHVLLSGCREGEYSQEFYHPKYGYRGVLTYFVCRNLYRYRRAGIPMNQLFSRIYRKVKENGFDQNPTLQGMPSLLQRGALGGRR